MKGINLFFECVQHQIKKYFFKDEIKDKSQACEQLKEMVKNENISLSAEQNEEYLLNYNRITRWQTL